MIGKFEREFKKLVNEGKITIKENTPLVKKLFEKSLEEDSKTKMEKTNENSKI